MTSNIAPPDVLRIADVELWVSDLDASRHFYVDILGMVLTLAESDALYLRGMEEFTHHSLVLRRGPVAAAARFAFRVQGPADVDQAGQYFTDIGCEVREVEAGETVGIGSAVRAVDPLGFPLEFFHEVEHVERLTQRYDLYRGVEPARIDHINVMTPNIPAGDRYLTNLGFRCTETIEDDNTLYAAWYRRKPTVHDVALTGGAGPRMHHVAFFTPEARNIMRLCDILGALNEQHLIERGPGRHGVSNAYYIYLRDPDGHRIEIYTSDYYTGDPDNPVVRWHVGDDRRRDFWGHAVVPSWYTEASNVVDLAGKPHELTERDEAAEGVVTGVLVGADGFEAPRKAVEERA